MFLCYSKRIFDNLEETCNEAGFAGQNGESHSEAVEVLYSS